MEPNLDDHPFFERPDAEPDNTYFDGRVVSWNKEVGDHLATLGVIQPGFDEVFEIDPGGEEISLNNPGQPNKLQIDLLDDGGEVEVSHVLEGPGQVSLPGGRRMRVTTPTDQEEVAYKCVYPESTLTE